MQEADMFGIFLSRLNGVGIQYMVTGSVASIIYGEPRLEFYKEGGSQKHIRDIEAMLRISKEIIDTDVLRTKALRMGLSDLFNHVTGLQS